MKLVQTIPLPGVKGRFDHFSIDAKGNRLFVAALGNNTLEAIDLAAAKRIQSVAGMSKPTGVLYLADHNQIAIANGDDATFKLLDGATFKVIQSLGEVPDADNLRLDPKTNLAWLGYGDGALGVIDTAVPKLTASVKLAAHPESFQMEKEGARIFVNVPDAKQIAVVDRDKRSVLAIWPMNKFQANFPTALDEPNHRLFFACRKPPRLVILDTETGKPVADLAISGDTVVIGAPYDDSSGTGDGEQYNNSVLNSGAAHVVRQVAGCLLGLEAKAPHERGRRAPVRAVDDDFGQ